MAQEGGRLSALGTGRFLPPGNTPGTHFGYRLSRTQGHSAIGRILCQWKIPMTPAGIEPATFRFVAQHLNHCATAVPCSYRKSFQILSIRVTTKYLFQWYRKAMNLGVLERTGWMTLQAKYDAAITTEPTVLLTASLRPLPPGVTVVSNSASQVVSMQTSVTPSFK